MAGVRVRNIVKGFDSVPVLKDVSLDIEDGEFLTLVGPSGCGKTTLLRIIAGLESQDGGDIRIGTVNVDKVPPRRRDVAMVFQSYALYPHMTVGENIALPLVMRRLSQWQRLPLLGHVVPGGRALRREIRREVRELAEALGIGEFLHRKPVQLSGGQRQRTAVGRALVRRPQVFLMDEPLSNLDAKLRVQMRTEIAELHRRVGVTFIYVTHDQAEAMSMSDRVAVMMEGRLLQVGSPEGVFADPDDMRVAEFIGSPKINLLDGVVRGDGAIQVLGFVVPVDTGLAPETPVRVGMRPESIEVDTEGGRGLRGRVRHTEYYGSDLYVHVDVDGTGAPLTVRLLPERSHEVQIGADVGLVPVLSRLLLFLEDGRRHRPATGESRRAAHG